MDPHPPTRESGAVPAPHTSLFPQIQPAKQRAMLAAIAHCLSVTTACAQVGITRETHYQWVRKFPAYAEARAEAQQRGAVWLDDMAIARATAGEKPSDVLLIFLLKAAKPAKYRETLRRDERSDVSELLKAVLLELADRAPARDVTPAPEAAWAYGEDAERYRAGWLCSTDNSCAFCVCVPCPPGRCGRRSGAIGTSLRDMHAGRPASTPRAAAPPPGHPAVVHGRASGGGAGPGPALTPPASPLPSLPGGGSVPAAMPCTAARWRLPRVTGARGGWFMTADTRCVCT